MKFTVVLAAVIAIAQAAPLINNGGKAIADSYIVVLKNGQTTESFQNKFDDIARRQNGRGRKPTIHHKFASFQGFAGTFNQAALKEILAADEVEYVEQDAIINLSGSQTSPPSWGLPRVSQRDLNIAANYLYNDAAGAGITAYIIDTGINPTHTDFGGRASAGANFISGSPNVDQNGHGTHVAGTIGGTKYGVAKQVKLVGVKVLSASGSGSTSGVVSGMDWVAANAVPGKSVVNMSLGGGKSASIDAAAQRLFNKGIPLIVAAGNDETMDACNGSPSGAANTFTVAASDKFDAPAYFTSWGSCVEIFAPGVGITSAWIGSNTATNTISGTSMASPHVAGVAALYLSYNSLPTAQAVFDKLISTATPNKITGNLKGSPNRLVFNGAV
ncbi:MAG: cuticle-degrading serine protease [Benniella sp.]|nr:MAG: cuticle-degrading serine protease [Benniella sp.]